MKHQTVDFNDNQFLQSASLPYKDASLDGYTSLHFQTLYSCHQLLHSLCHNHHAIRKGKSKFWLSQKLVQKHVNAKPDMSIKYIKSHNLSPPHTCMRMCTTHPPARTHAHTHSHKDVLICTLHCTLLSSSFRWCLATIKPSTDFSSATHPPRLFYRTS
jgi:hypothetical protein